MNSAFKSLVNRFSPAFIAWLFVFMSFLPWDPGRSWKAEITCLHLFVISQGLVPRRHSWCYFLMNGASEIVPCVLTGDKDCGSQGLFVKPIPYEVRELPAYQAEEIEKWFQWPLCPSLVAIPFV